MDDQKNREPPDDVMDATPDIIGERPSRHPPPPPRLRAMIASPGGRPLRVTGEPRVARDLMTRELLTIGPDDTLESREEQMRAFRFRHLPVVDGDILVGLISHSDLLHTASSRLSTTAPQENQIINHLPAWKIMRQRHQLVTVRPDEELTEVAALLWGTRVGCVPVTEESGVLVGIITEGDFVRLAHHLLVGRQELH